MKIICKDKVIDLSKFETVRTRESFFGESEGYPVEAIRHYGGISIATEEIARCTSKENAEELVKAITDSWIKEEKFFDATKWTC